MPAFPILLYHSVSDDPPEEIAEFAVTPAVFRRHLDLIVAGGHTPLTVSGLLDALGAGTLPPRPVVVTFDDGWADNYAVLAGDMAARAIPSTLYVTTGRVGRDPRHLTWRQVQQLAGAGVEIGAHSRTHPQLDTLPVGRANGEVAGSRIAIGVALGLAVRTFAYPHGYSTPALRSLVHDAGYDSACAVNNALSGPGDDRYALSRLTLRATTPDSQVAKWLMSRGAGVAPPPDRLRARAWRTWRRARAALARQPTAA